MKSFALLFRTFLRVGRIAFLLELAGLCLGDVVNIEHDKPKRKKKDPKSKEYNRYRKKQ